jgi:hypothetical protein
VTITNPICVNCGKKLHRLDKPYRGHHWAHISSNSILCKPQSQLLATALPCHVAVPVTHEVALERAS